MTSGVSMWSRSASATWAPVSGTWDADYPVANLSDLIMISNVARVAPASNAAALIFTQPAAQLIQFVGLVNHTLLAGAEVRVRLFSDNNPDPVGNAGAIVADTTVIDVWPTGGPVDGYPSQRPILLDAAVTARSGRIDLSSLAGDAEIGGIELSQFWSWDLGPGKDFGFDPRDSGMELATGVRDGEDSWMPRILSGQIDFLALAEAASTGLDFQATMGTAKPFLFVEDIDDASTWARSAMLAVNVTTPLSSGVRTRRDKFQFRLREHWR